MKIGTRVALALLEAVGFVIVAQARGIDRPRVEVCVEGDIEDGIEANVIGSAQGQATRTFRRVGVQLEWHRDSASLCQQSGYSVIRVTYSFHTPIDLAPSALAYSLPYEGVNIEAFYDRVPGNNDAECAAVLGYVLVHEITHILQGVARHSDSGIMKAQWDKADFVRMRLVPMSFTEEDVDLIHKGLQVRAKLAASETLLAVSGSHRTVAGSSNIEKSAPR